MLAQVAIKQLQNDGAYDKSRAETPLEQFMVEVETTIKIAKGTPNVVECFGWSTMKDGLHCLVMKLYAKSLYHLIDESEDLLHGSKRVVDAFSAHFHDFNLWFCSLNVPFSIFH